MRKVNVISDLDFSFLHDLSKPLAVLAIIIVVALCVESIFGSLPWFKIIGTRGKIEVETLGVGVYLDPLCTNPVESLDWGTTEPGSITNIGVVIRNEGNRYSTLFLNTTDWNPADASNYLTLLWDYDGRTLAPNETITVTLSLALAIATPEIGNFTFDIIIGTNRTE
jgi:hypothetical protein